ncbi:WG repeat-containing protein [Neobacillus sp. 179-C4.2 HS]|uniref:WG repeat-containing protein n=1 Tax=Neobacillus driksii TaxID=3035913 RepID=A0ABV4YXF7_9BACI|nr:WG repeat-containing protein [Neobacillus sp. 179.-C4.2 HS]MDP5195823.1 WG repeat-containing protein [Neobacillus sp. 179.-C4.2 HS]
MSRRNTEQENWITYLLSLSRMVYLFPAEVKDIGGGKWGYINEKGAFVLPPKYEMARDFQENGLAIIQLNNLTGIINTDGYFIVKPKYETIIPFSEGRATAIDHEGFKVLDESGKEITSKAYSFIGDFQEGRAAAANTNEQGNYLYGYLNRRGNEVIPLSFESASDFEHGKALVKIKEGSYSLIDLTGKVLHSYSFPFVDDYGEGMLAFRKSNDGKWGYMDESGKVLIEPQFIGTQPFVEHRAIVNVENNHYGLIDRQGKYIIKPQYSSLLNLGENRYALGKAQDPERPYLFQKYAIADADGHIYTGFIYNGVSEYKDGVASAYNDEMTFFIDKRGQRLNHLPMMQGGGTLAFNKSLIKGDIDLRILYFDKKGTLVWKQNTIIPLKEDYSVTENKFKPNKDYLVYYPQLTGVSSPESVNQTLKELSGVKAVPQHTQLESSYAGDFDVSFYKNNLVVLEINGYDYPFGAAHGMPVKKYAHIDLKTGRFYQLKELFKQEADYVKVISDIIGEQIKNDEQYSYVFPDTYKGIKADQPFFISEGALNIYFEPYEIAPYAAGFPTFTIPFHDLSSIIDHDGVFWRSFH